MSPDDPQRPSRGAAWLTRLARTPAGYGLAVVVVGAALALRAALSSVVGTGVTYITFYPAVMFIATLCGLRPGVFATVLSAFCAAAWIIPAHGVILSMLFGDVVGLAVFCCMGTLMSLVAERYHRAQARADAYEKDLLVRQAEEHFRSFFNNPAVGAVRVDLEGRFQQVNDRFCTLTGYTPRELVGMSATDLSEPARREEERALLARFLRGEMAAYDVERRCLRKGGGGFWVHMVLGIARDDVGRPLHANGIVEDIDEVREAEAERETIIELLRVVNKAVGIRETAQAAVSFFQDRSGCDAVGVRLLDGDDYPYFEVRGFPKEFVELESRLCAHDEAGALLRDSAGDPVLECICGQVIQGRADSTKPYFTVGGSFFWSDTAALGATMASADRPKQDRNRCTGLGYQSVALVPLRAGGTTLGLLQLNDRRAGMFSRSRIALWERLAGYLAVALAKTRADEALRAANAQLADTDRRRTEFLAVLSHELRNPLTPVRNSLYILRRTSPGGDQARRAQAVLDRQVTHLTRLVDDLLDVTRISHGKVHLQRERLDLNEVVKRTVEDHASTFAAAGLRLELEAHSEPIWASGDRTRLGQVIGNLLQNSAKFTPMGGQVVVSVLLRPGGALVLVRDTGAGIAPEVLPRLFEPFSQADMALDRSKGGLGLGLALVKGMVELHGGSVAGESNGVGQGATFTIQLPLEPSEPLGAQRPRGERAVSEGPVHRRVLVIEDNIDAADSLREVLGLAGHEVEVAYGGAQGIEKAQSFAPDVVLCDIGLPGMDGYEVARRIRSDPRLCGLRLVALTGYAQPDDIARANEAGFDVHLPKPPDPRALERLVGGDTWNDERFDGPAASLER
jgi:two-component system CheB/CheR fusion protein